MPFYLAGRLARTPPGRHRVFASASSDSVYRYSTREPLDPHPLRASYDAV